MIPKQAAEDSVRAYLTAPATVPLFLCGASHDVLKKIPDAVIDCAITSPPYWNKRLYHNGGIGLEASYEQYISNLLVVIDEVARVLKPSGSFWLNIGDTYTNKSLLGIPWRVAITMMDHGWILRNEIIWNKIKGGLDNSTDKLRNVHEQLFHFVRIPKGYYYNLDAVRSKPHQSRVVNGAIVTSSGVRGVRYQRQIECSTALSESEKKTALHALQQALDYVRRGTIADFRMIIRGQQRTTHSDAEQVSGRARDLAQRGFYILRYHPNGSKPSDVWDILPEDTQQRVEHFAPYPEDLCRIPILTTCPAGGIVLDPFCGTGTTNLVARKLQRKSVGIDIAPQYIAAAEDRCRMLL